MDMRLIEIIKTMRIPLEFNAKSGSKILIMTDTRIDPILWQAMAAVAESMNIETTVTIMTPREAHGYDPTSPVVAAAMDPSVDLVIYMTSTAMAHAPMNAAMLDAGRRFILMEELTPEMMLPDGPGGADYVAMDALGTKIAELFTRADTVRVTADNGTDLIAAVGGRPGRSVTARIPVMRANGAGGCAFPDGEVHVCPLEGTGEGVVVFDLTAHNVGRIKDPIRINVTKGMATSIDGGIEAQKWRDIFAKYGDPNSFNCPAEIAIGLNPNVTPTGSMRTDKKLFGSVHIGLGDTLVIGGTCHAKLRLEGVIAKPTVFIGDVKVVEHGNILV